MTLLDQTCSEPAAALSAAAVAALLPDVPQWHVADASLRRRYRFANWVAAAAFADAVAVMVERHNHHPVLTLSYGACELAFTTHSAGNAISNNDFICAAHADALYQAQP